MADVNPAPTPDPVQAVSHPPDLCVFCFRDWCQDQAARVQMDPTDYSTYMRLAWNYYNQVTPYDQFQIQLKTLLERPDREYGHLQPYWNVFHRGYIERMPLEDDPLFVYPVHLCGLLNRIPGFDFCTDPEQGNRIMEHNRREADRINAQIRAAFELRSKPKRGPYRKRKTPKLEQATLEGAAGNNVETQADTPQRRPYRKREAPKLEQATLEGAADNEVVTQTDTPKRRPYRKRKAPKIEQVPLEGAADNKVETQADTPKRRPYRKRKAPKLEQAPIEGAADNEVETQTDTPKRRPYRKREAPKIEQAPLEGAADNKVETQTDIPKKRPYRKRKAPKLEQAPIEGAADKHDEGLGFRGLRIQTDMSS